MQVGLKAQVMGQDGWAAMKARPEMAEKAAVKVGAQLAGRGEKIVARLDQDGDGKLGLNELAGTRIGKKMTVDRMARMDANGNGMLEASEFNRRKGVAASDAAAAAQAKAAPAETVADGKPGAVEKPAQKPSTEAAIIAQMADYYAAKVSPEDQIKARAEALAQELVKRLDADGSGKLNTEEIAGTRLAEKIGEGFYKLDADRNGGLDLEELFGFLRQELMAQAEKGDWGAAAEGAKTPAGETPVAVDTSAETALEQVKATVEAAEADAAKAAEAAEAKEADYELSAADLVKTAFENALRMIKEGQEARSTYDVVSALYGNVKDILQSA